MAKGKSSGSGTGKARSSGVVTSGGGGGMMAKPGQPGLIGPGQPGYVKPGTPVVGRGPQGQAGYVPGGIGGTGSTNRGGGGGVGSTNRGGGGGVGSTGRGSTGKPVVQVPSKMSGGAVVTKTPSTGPASVSAKPLPTKKLPPTRNLHATPKSGGLPTQKLAPSMTPARKVR